MPSIMAGWRVSLLRTRADWPIVAAAWLTMLLAATLLAAGPIYSDAVALAGLRQTLADAPVAAANVQVSERVTPDEADGVDATIRYVLGQAAGNVPAQVARVGVSDSFALPGQSGTVRNLALIGFADGIEGHATLVAGSWPVATAPTAPGLPSTAPVPVAVSAGVARQLGLAVGDDVNLVSRLDTAFEVPVSIVAIYRIDDPRDPFWWSDPQLIEGVSESANYRTYGPFVTSREDFLARAVVRSSELAWRLLPDYRGFTIDDTGPLRARIEALPGWLHQALPEGQQIVDTQLPATLADADRALLVSRTSVLVLMVQLAALGGYSILLTAGLLTDHRRVETALLRSRGAGPGQVGVLAAVEGLFLAVPAVALGPWLAVAALELFDRFGPLAGTGIEIDLRVTSDAYLAAGIAGAACVALLTVPAVLSARAFSVEQRALSRQETRPLVQRLGLDVALLTVAALGLWQLRLYGAPLTRTVRGTLGPDPLLVAAPALGLLAGAAVALRLLPRLAEAGEHLMSRGRGLVGSMGTRQLARRPLRYTRSGLLLMLAMSMGVFAVSYATTWTGSQRDQAGYQVGADVRVVPGRTYGALPDWALANAYAGIDGVTEAMPVERIDARLTQSARVTVLAVDAASAGGLVRFRDDQAGQPLDELLAPLAAARPDPAAPTIPSGSTQLVVGVTLDVRRLEQPVQDPETGAYTFQRVDPTVLDDQQAVRVGIAVRDSHQVVTRFTGPWVTVAEARAGTAIVLGSEDPAEAQVDEPLKLVSIDISLALPTDLSMTDSTISVASLAGRSATGDQAMDPLATGPWRATIQPPVGPAMVVPDERLQGLSVVVGPGAFPSELPGQPLADAYTLSLQPAGIDLVGVTAVPALVNQPLLTLTGLGVGDSVPVDLAGTTRQLLAVGVVDSFPTLDPALPFMVVDLPTLTLLRLQAVHAGGTPASSPIDAQPPDEWWLGAAASNGDQAAVEEQIAEALLAPPILSADVTTARGRLRTLAGDPVAVGIIGALSLGAVAAGLFAIVGLAVGAAVSARQRQTEFALLRAVGLSRRQLAGWLWLEHGSLVVVSLIAGTALGIVISWAVLPAVAVSREGVTPVPPVLVTLPLDTIAVLELVTATALLVVVAVMAALLRRMGIGSVLRLGDE